jgi:hypothetical protein
MITAAQPHRTEDPMTRFQIGKTYQTRSIADYDTIFSFEILGRTQKTITTKVHGKTVRRGIFYFAGIEQFKPFGTMCAIISAHKPS